MPCCSDIQIVTVTHNSSSIIERFLTSFADAEGIELTVVDSGSQDIDDLSEMLAAYGQRVIGIADNVGFGTASNVGAATSTSKWIAFVNPDVWVSAETLRAMADHADSYGIACVGPVVRRPDGSPMRVASDGLRPPWRRGRRAGPLGVGAGLVASISGCCMVVLRSAFDAVQGFDEAFFMFAEELDLQQRLWDAGYSVGVAAHCSAFTPGGSSSSTTSRRWSATERHVAHVQYYRKHYARAEALAAAVLGLSRILLGGREYYPLGASVAQYVSGLKRVSRSSGRLR